METLRRAHKKSRTTSEEMDDARFFVGGGKVTKGGEEEVDCVEVFEMEGCEEEEEARGYEVEVCGMDIVCWGRK